MRPNLSASASSKVVESSRLVEALRQRHMTGGRIAVGLAALIYLRWLDFQEAEQQAIAAFEGRDHNPLLAERARWRNWTEPRGDDTAGWFFLAELRDALGNCLPIGFPEWWALGEGLSAFSRDPDILASEDEWGVELAVKWLKARPFDTPGDRRRLLHAYDEILAGCEGLPDGIHRTPPELARLVAGLAAPAAGERVYDPCLGTAGLLTAALDAVGATGPGARPFGDGRMLSLSGADLRSDTLMIALARLALAGVQAPSLALGNSLERLPPDKVPDGFDLVLADPPMGMRVEPQGLGHLPVPTRDSTSLFVQHAIQQLCPRGRALVIVPQGFLFRRGPEARLRERLVRNHQIEAVVGLPPGAYGPGAGIRIAILVLHREGGDGRIRMVDGEAAMKALGLRPNEGLDPRANAAIVEAAQGASESEVAWSVDAENLAALDWDLTPQRRDLSALDRTLDDLPEGAGRVSLGAIAEVVSGASVPAGVLAYERSEERSIPYLRIGDVQQGRVMAPKGWVAPEAAKGAYRLRPGDLLVSKSGTVGKVAWVGEREVGAVAGSGFYCLRPDQDRIDSRYLAAYLQADTCRAWLKDRGTGSTIAHLPIGAIRDLPVPLPPIPVQERVARAFAERGEDAVAALRRILEVESNDLDTPAVRDWMTGLLDQAPDLPGDGLDPSKAVAALTEWLRERPPVRRCGTCGIPYSLLDADQHPGYVGPPYDYSRGVGTTCLSCWLDLEPGEGAGHAPAGGLLDWAIAFDDALRPLQGMASIPPGPALLALIQDARRRFAALGPLLRDDPTDTRVASRVLGHADTLLATAERSLFARASLKFVPDSARLVPGARDEQGITIMNPGPLPLRDLRIWADVVLAGTAELPWLAEGATARAQFTNNLPSTSGGGPIEVLVHWRARTLEGTQVGGSDPLTFESTEAARATGIPEDLGSSPYVGAAPIGPDRDDVFFGRDMELGQIRRQVETSGNVVLLEGNRRAGKTSILKHLEGRNAVPGWLGVYCSLQDAPGSDGRAGVPTVEVFRLMARELAKATHRLGLDTPLPDGSVLTAKGKPLGVAKACRTGIGSDGAFSDFGEYLDILLDLLEDEGLGVLLLLDEFDKLQEGIDNGVTSPQVPENIRFLVQNHPRFSAVLTGSRRLKRLREEYWSALFGLGTRIGVTSLPRDAAQRLITSPVQGRLTYSAAAVDRVIFLTAAQPFLIQNLCNRIFDVVATEVRSILSEIEDATAVNDLGKATAAAPNSGRSKLAAAATAAALGRALAGPAPGRGGAVAALGPTAAGALASPIGVAVALGAAAAFLLVPEIKKRLRNAIVHGRSEITPEVVDLAAAQMVRDNEHFAALWGYAGSERRRFVLALVRHADRSKNRGGLRFAELIQRLAAEGVLTPDEALDADLDHLRELELVDMIDNGDGAQYRLAVPVMGLWIDNQLDFDGLRAKARFETEDEHG